LLRSILIQAVVFLLIFNGVAMLREMSMLSTSDHVTPKPQQLKTITNEDILLQANGKQTIVYFFAPWCQVCNFSIENLQNVYQKTPDLNVIAVALDFVDVEEVKKFTTNHQLTFPVALGNEQVKANYKVMGYPSYYVLDEENTIISRSLGYSTEIGLYLRSF
jgi:thiol-disulfide isomerase/thioredoxin|tara:strand:- start:24600 stop:25085 length:486 start_codon:yes stop_codon:yes gene_type:complete